MGSEQPSRTVMCRDKKCHGDTERDAASFRAWLNYKVSREAIKTELRLVFRTVQLRFILLDLEEHSRLTRKLVVAHVI